MAETWKAKAKRYSKGDFTNTELKILLGGMLADQAIDVLTFGKLSKLKGKALQKVGIPLLRMGGGAAVRSGPRALGTVARGARFVAMRHPYITAAVVTYEVAKNREQIAALAREGWEVVEPYAQDIYDVAEPTGVYDIQPGARQPGFLESTREKFFEVAKRPKSKYNKAVSAGMKAVKASAKGGKKGTISNPKSTFKTVAKVASKISKGVKVSPIGISGIAATAARKIYGKVKKSKKKTKKRGATYTYRK